MFYALDLVGHFDVTSKQAYATSNKANNYATVITLTVFCSTGALWCCDKTVSCQKVKTFGALESFETIVYEYAL